MEATTILLDNIVMFIMQIMYVTYPISMSVELYWYLYRYTKCDIGTLR